jgi:ectoine hydroxylase-related dioxygenase (phytanoyl-CoA dioxygenase family)
MLTSDQIRGFHENGYLCVPGILTPNQVAELRAALRPKFEAPAEKRFLGDSDRYLFDVFSRHSDLRWLLCHEPMLEVLRDLLGDDFVVLREAAAHFQGFGGWHKDTSAQERDGQTFHKNPDYLMVEAGFYLQDNSAEFGGGLDVVPGSQREPDPFIRKPGLLARLLAKLRVRPLGYAPRHVLSIPSKAGDLVIFDFRVNHQATQPRNTDMPAANQKFAVFLACSRNNQYARAYNDYIATRPGYEYLTDFTYPADLIDTAQRHGVTLV